MPGFFDGMGMGMGGAMDDEQKKYAGTMGLLGLASNLLQAGAPSTNPASGNLGAALGQGIQGGMAGLGMAQNQLNKAQESRYMKTKSEEAAANNEIMKLFLNEMMQGRNATLGQPTQRAGLNPLETPQMLQGSRQALPFNAPQTPQLPPNLQATLGLQQSPQQRPISPVPQMSAPQLSGLDQLKPTPQDSPAVARAKEERLKQLMVQGVIPGLAGF